jgi:hypothetical protein
MKRVSRIRVHRCRCHEILTGKEKKDFRFVTLRRKEAMGLVLESMAMAT